MEAFSRTALETQIREVIHELLEMPITPHVRELRAKAVTYGRVINNWSTYPPTAPQVQAMHECVAELHDKVKSAQREVSRVSRKPSPPTSSAPVTTRSGSGAAPPPPARPRTFPEPPETIPPGVAWNANVSDSTGIRARRRREESLTPTETPALTITSRPPHAAPTAPPVSRPQAHDTHDTPTPALLRSRRSR